MKALLFGSIGTICSTSDVQLAGYNAAFNYAGLDWFWDDATYRRLLSVTGGKERLRYYASDHESAPLDDSLINQIHERKTEYCREAMRPGKVFIRQGVGRLIRAAQSEGVKLAFVTTTERRNIEALEYALESDFSLSDFDFITDRDMVSAEKPSPAAYKLTLETLSCHASEAVAVEDTSACVASAVDAGVACIATPHEFSLDQDFSSAIACVNHLGDPDASAHVIHGKQITDSGMVTLDKIRTVLHAGKTAE